MSYKLSESTGGEAAVYGAPTIFCRVRHICRASPPLDRLQKVKIKLFADFTIYKEL